MNQFDRAVELQLDLMRVSSSMERDVLRILLSMRRELLGRVADGNLTEWGKARVKSQIREAADLIESYYTRAGQINSEGLQAVAEVTARATGASLIVTESAALIPPSAIEAVAKNAVVQGAVVGDWWAKQSTDTAFRFGQAVRQGVVGGETNQQIIGRVRQFLDVSRANAAALVQTSVATVANDAREAVFERNADIIKRYRAVATLDSNTCLTCAPLDGLEWMPDGKPKGHRFPRPNYPLHFNCRCLLIPVVIDEPQGGERASADGPVSAKLTFRGWLDRQTPDKQADILGKGRAELYRKGKLTLTDLVRGNGSPLTVAELQRKYE